MAWNEGVMRENLFPDNGSVFPESIHAQERLLGVLGRLRIHRNIQVRKISILILLQR